MNSCDEEIDKLTKIIREKGGDAVRIAPKDVITAHWVRQKCYFGCAGFGKRFGCPPNSPTPDETRQVLDEFSTALLIRFDGDLYPDEADPLRVASHKMTRFVQSTMVELEDIAFHDGFYKVLSYSGHQCKWCKSCAAKEAGAELKDCRMRQNLRPSMEAAGIDVYATCKNAGWDLRVMTFTMTEEGKVWDGPMTTIMLLLLE
ncbi:MAG TPA: DUF2284 domain-containing protein [Methanocorpusculum sp.]|nr:DUF2284 domain-containing protein [Methanocorpusculum sp.]